MTHSWVPLGDQSRAHVSLSKHLTSWSSAEAQGVLWRSTQHWQGILTFDLLQSLGSLS